jgi:hypothetical protein
MGNLPRTGCAALVIAWEKSPINAWVFFIIDAMVILPYLKIYHENGFGKFTKKMQNFGKFTVSFWKIYHEKTNFGKFTILWELFHGNRYYGKIPMDIWNNALRWREAGKN